MTSTPARNQPIGIGVVGLGFMGETHVRAYRSVRDATLVAVCDQDASRFDGRARGSGNIGPVAHAELLFDPDRVRTTTDAHELLADPRVEAISICTHTGTHADIARAAIHAGKHVLIEKPVALAPHEIEAIDEDARRAGIIAMPAMCMRFWPGWDWLHARVLSGDMGRVTSATFQRLGARPSWGAGFYDDEAQSGGALFDLHIHDADIVRWLFGDPCSVQSTGSTSHLTTLYRFPHGPIHVTAEGGWGHHASFGFRMRYVVAFERGTAEFDLTRRPSLIVSDDRGTHPIDLPNGTGYEAEIGAFVRACMDGTPPPVSLSDATAVTRMLLAERESLRTGHAIDPRTHEVRKAALD